ncbi:MAG: S41 family peptidase [Halobacteriovoraceae bacterium]|jgi:carboxyl-terminal processing protease|nr:S41 family peptidase [Halobacteriovoraceae bacterium]MBT5095502.1 S41 family peptidase [Halobacteriovoraceae bacterium]
MKKTVLIVAFVLLASANSFAAKSRYEKLELFNKVLYLIESQYYRKVDTGKLIQGAIKGMMNTLDPHSAFLNKEVFAKMQEDTSGEFGGLGLEVTQKDGVIIVITPIEDTPAYEAGLKPGDKIVEIDHESTVGISLEEAVEKMRGKPKSKVSIGIVREGVDGVKQMVVRRKIIQIQSVKSNLIDGNYVFIRLTQFQKNAAKNISTHIRKMKKKIKKSDNMKGIILDLRSNPGGLLEEAVDVSSIFLKDGIVVSTEGRDPKNKEIRYVKKTGHKELEAPLVVLINGASASASEIVAGALQDTGRAIILGSQSFGKGSVQTVAKIDDEKGVKLTIAQYMTPTGRKIQAIGIKPDVLVAEFEEKWVDSHNKTSYFVRERDLRNHLNATIETKEEKAARLIEEKEERQLRKKRLKALKQAHKNKNDKAKNVIKTYQPAQDYLVLQAVNYLKSYRIFKKLQ